MGAPMITLSFGILSIISALAGLYYSVQSAKAHDFYEQKKVLLSGFLLLVISVLALVMILFRCLGVMT